MMTQIQMIPRQVYWPKMPLAVYREVAAHLRQAGVEVELLPQTADYFDYELSQVGGLRIDEPDGLDAASQARVLRILQYYRDRFGKWRSP
jgi:hypothetical protein